MDNQSLGRRRAPRFRCTGAAEIIRGGSRWGWARVNEISRGGCYIETVQPLPIGTEAQLRLTIADTLLDIGAKVASTDPVTGMGIEFLGVSQEQESKIVHIIETVTGTEQLSASQQAERPHPSTATVRITREAAPEILAKIIKQINEKGVVTRQDLVEIVKQATPAAQH